jgi:hypothetical protein
MAATRKINLRVGRGTQVGDITLASWTPDRIFLSISSNDGYAPTVILTPEQVRELRRALEEIAPQNEEKLRLVA